MWESYHGGLCLRQLDLCLTYKLLRKTVVAVPRTIKQVGVTEEISTLLTVYQNASIHELNVTNIASLGFYTIVTCATAVVGPYQTLYTLLCPLRVAFHDHPLFINEDRLSASLRTLFGRYRAKLEADGDLYLRRRLSASLSTLLKLR